MTSLNQILSVISANKNSLRHKYKISKIGVFGSYCRNEATNDSDFDILVEFAEPIGLDFVLLAEELENLIGNKVELVSLNAIKPKLREYIEAELVYV